MRRRRPAGGSPLRAFTRFWGRPIPWSPTPSRHKRPVRAAARSPSAGSLPHRPGTAAKPPAPANPLNARCPRTADGRISCAQRSQRDYSLRVCFAFGVGFSAGSLQSKCCDFGFAISSADPCPRGACPQRLARLPEARKAVADGSGGHPFALQRRGELAPDRPSVAHGGLSMRAQLAVRRCCAVVSALCRVRLARWVLVRLCSFVLTP